MDLDIGSVINDLISNKKLIKKDNWYFLSVCLKDKDAYSYLNLIDMETKKVVYFAPLMAIGLFPDINFEGHVVSVFGKRCGIVRIVVENQDGILHIFNPSQLKKEESSGH